ncbi:MAG: ATPase, T2SS/T4P/T4SS family [Acidimicrobiia bacterium]
MRGRSLLRLDRSGMPRETRRGFLQLVKSPFGMVICGWLPPARARRPRCTPSFSEINSPERNIMTIEDPVEYVFPSINQIQINEQAGHHVLRRPQGDPAPGPRRDPRR